MAPDKSHCSQCGARLAYTKHSETLAGRLEALFQKVGRAVVLGGAVIVLLLLLTGGLYIASYFRGSGAATASDQAATINTIVNSSFNTSNSQPSLFKVVVPSEATNARVVGGYKVTSGKGVNFYILDDKQYEQWANGSKNFSALTQRDRSASARLRQTLKSGTYYLIFANNEGATEGTSVAAEFYLKYD
jgi:hypothetical protein